MKRTVSLFLYMVICALLCGVCGCAGLLNRDYQTVSTHLEKHSDGGEESFQRAGNFSELKEAIIQLIRQNSETGEIRLYSYPGDISSDVSRACQEVMREEPIGAYAVDYMSPKYTSLVSYTELLLSITYRPDRVKEIPGVLNVTGFREEIEAAMQSFAPHLVVEIGYFEQNDTDINDLVRDVYYALPAQAVGRPEIEFSLYPDGGLRRIIALDFSYPDTPERMWEKAAEAEAALEGIVLALPPELEPPYASLWLYDALHAAVTYDANGAKALREGRTKGIEDDLYSALVQGHAVVDGYALAYKRLCDMAGISCQLVGGRRDNAEYVWNLIRLDDAWYHADPAADADGGTHDWFLKTDEDMKTVAWWNMGATPRCESTQYNYDMLAQSNEPDASGATSVHSPVGPSPAAAETSPPPDEEPTPDGEPEG